MNILIVSLHEDLRAIGIKYLHYYLLNNGYQSFILYLPNFKLNDKKQLGSIKKFVEEVNPRFIGISLMSHRYHLACYLSEYLKSFVKSIPVIWGGIHPTISPKSCLNYADYVCIGEGERALLEIANSLEKGGDFKKVNNLCYRENGLVKNNPMYPLIENLDELPPYEYIPVNSFVMTNKDIVKLTKNFFIRYDSQFGKMYGIIATRGCPFSCTYCCNNALLHLYQSKKIRRRSISNVIEQVEMALRENPEIEYINFQDDCFLSCTDEYLKEFCAVYKRRVGKPFIIRGIPIYINEDKLRSLKHAGLSWITLGLQSGSDRTCKEVYKRSSFRANFLQAAKTIADFKIAAFYDVILDNPFESKEDMLETAETLTETPRPFLPQFFSLVMYYGTELYERAQSELPGFIEEYLRKNYFMLQKNTINNLIQLTPFIHKRYMRKIISLYKLNPRSLWFKINLFVANLLSLFIFQPLYYFQVIRLSQGGSYLKGFKVLPIYIREGVWRYINQFK